MTPTLYVGTLFVIAYALKERFMFKFEKWQAIVFPIVTTILGLISIRLLYYVNYGTFNGQFFYAAALTLPFYSYPVAKILKLNYFLAMDYAAIYCMLMTAFANLGLMINSLTQGTIEFFGLSIPNTWVDCAAQFALAGLLVWLSKKREKRYLVYGWFYVIYGIQRIFSEQFRGIYSPEFFGLNVATFWCLICIVLGIAWLILIPKYRLKSKSYAKILEEEAQQDQQIRQKEKLEKIRQQKQKIKKQKSHSKK